MSLQSAELQPQIIAAIFRRLEENFRNGQTNLLADDLLQLRSVFGGHQLERALDIVDRPPTVGSGGIVCYRTVADSDRQVLEVAGSAAGQVYKLLPNINYCACASFRYQVLLLPGGGAGSAQPQLTCKHVLACRLAGLLHCWRVQLVSAEHFAVISEQFARQ